MKRIYVVLTILLFSALLPFTSVYAKDIDNNNISISIQSPTGVKNYPGIEKTIKAEIKNNTNKPIKDILVYITMTDIKKSMTVNLEDYSADKPITVNLLNPNETKTVELPIRFVYTSNYYLYTTVVSKQYKQIVSSDSIKIEIMGNTKVDKSMVMIVSFVEPLLLIFGTVFIIIRNKI